MGLLENKLLSILSEGLLFVDDGRELGWAGEPAINCNDWFALGCADYVDITLEDIDLIEKSILDIEYVYNGSRHVAVDFGFMLFACRKRKEKPCSRRLDRLPDEVKHLFKDI
jgi:hypothetical protein